MNRVRRLIALLFVALAYFQGRYNYEQIDSMLHPGRDSAAPLIADESRQITSLRAEAEAAGLRLRDRVLLFDGQPLTGAAAIHRLSANHRPGDAVPVSVSREGQTLELKVALPARIPGAVSPADWAFLLLTRAVTPWVCLLLGVFVAMLRPHDRLAWLLLGLMLSFGLLAVNDGLSSQISRWDTPSASSAAFTANFGVATWPLWMMLFGAYFPDRKPSGNLWIVWFRRIFGFILLLFGVAQGAASASYLENFEAMPWLLAVLSRVDPYFWVFSFPATGSFFAAIARKAATERQPDARRRLRLLYFGSFIALTPVFGCVLATLPWGRSLTSLPVWVWAPALALLSLFPLTLAYIIIVQRAMDVRVVLRQGMKYAVATRGLQVVRVLAIAAGAFFMLQTINDPSSRRPARLQAIAIAVGIALWSRVALTKLTAWLDRRFFREAVDTERVLGELGDQVRNIVDRQSLLEKVAATIASAMHVSRVSALVDSGGWFRPAYAYGFGEEPTVALRTGGPIVSRIDAASEPLRYYADDPESWARTDPAMESERPALEALQAELLLPLRAGNRLMGLLTLGPKRSEEPYSTSDVRLLQSVAVQTSLALENGRLAEAVAQEVAQRERLNRELEIAREVQEKLFPKAGPAVAGLDYAGYCRPAQSVGGDYYDFFATPSGELGLAIGDISGKGIPAALLMASLQASLRGLTLGRPSALAALMENLNRLLYDASPANRYATFFYGQYDSSSRKLTYVNGGHNAPMLLRASGEVERLEAGGPPVGLFGPARYTQAEVTLGPGDVLALYTDGVSEALNPLDEEFGEDRLLETLRAAETLPLAEVIPRVFAACDAFASGAAQHDDMTLVVVRVQA